MIMTANDRLKELEDDMTSLFSLPKPTTQNIGSSSYSDFSWFVHHTLTLVVKEHYTELLTQKPTSENLPGWFLMTHLIQYSLSEDDNLACSECFPAVSRLGASVLGNPQDTCSELLLLQHRVVCHIAEDDGYWEAHVNLSHEVKKRAGEILVSHGLPASAKWAKSLGVYHPEFLLYYVSDPTEDLSDCLERSWLHLRMDDVDCLDDGDSFRTSLDVSIVKDEQDILGRTALIIACQEAWPGTVRWLLEEEADPGLTTMYGSLPLHYAAAKGSIDICQLLLSHKTKFDIKAKDCVYKTPLDYARGKGHYEVVKLLSAEYAAADQALEELERERSLQGSYFV